VIGNMMTSLDFIWYVFIRTN